MDHSYFLRGGRAVSTTATSVGIFRQSATDSTGMLRDQQICLAGLGLMTQNRLCICASVGDTSIYTVAEAHDDSEVVKMSFIEGKRLRKSGIITAWSCGFRP